jgi:hypothetical protein
VAESAVSVAPARRLAARLFAALLALAPAGVVAQQPAPLGEPPKIVNRALSAVPNAQAFHTHIWVPGLDEGFVPQGLAWQAGELVLAGYVSTDRNVARGPCWVYRVDPASGRTRSRTELPSSCGHAGGVAALADGRVVVADTRRLFVISRGALVQEVRLEGELRGSFADFDGQDLWIGSYNADGPGQLWRLPVALLGRAALTEKDAAARLPAPAEAQGLAFAPGGQMWIATSGAREGTLKRVNKTTGAVEFTYAAPAGVEDIAFDGAGRLWASSEAGARRWAGWDTFYPLLFAVDVGRLR